MTQLQYFRAAARLENISKAAEELHVSQPNLSRAIGRLEDSIGVRLFDRSPGKVRLNEYGRVYLNCVDRAFSLLDSGEQQIRDMAVGSKDGRISVACPMQLYMENMIEAYVTGHPKDNLGIQHGQKDIAAIDREIWDGSLDFALAQRDGFSPGIDWQPVFSCPVSVLVSDTSPLAKRREIRLEELKSQRFICNGAGMNHSLTEKLCREAGFQANIVFESNESAFVGSWLEKERGVALISFFDLLSLSCRPNYVLPLKPLKIIQPSPVLEMGIVKLADREFTGRQKTFYNFALSFFTRLGDDLSSRWEDFWE